MKTTMNSFNNWNVWEMRNAIHAGLTVRCEFRDGASLVPRMKLTFTTSASLRSRREGGGMNPQVKAIIDVWDACLARQRAATDVEHPPVHYVQLQALIEALRLAEEARSLAWCKAKSQSDVNNIDRTLRL